MILIKLNKESIVPEGDFRGDIRAKMGYIESLPAGPIPDR
jgi:hypothetical protein